MKSEKKRSGVLLRKGRYYAKVRHKGVTLHLGSFATEMGAAAAAAKKKEDFLW